jgi:hypothetical protein|nr:MAG TPA: hypothetical protein [Caudoviricetes sp.]
MNKQVPKNINEIIEDEAYFEFDVNPQTVNDEVWKWLEIKTQDYHEERKENKRNLNEMSRRLSKKCKL